MDIFYRELKCLSFLSSFPVSVPYLIASSVNASDPWMWPCSFKYISVLLFSAEEDLYL